MAFPCCPTCACARQVVESRAAFVTGQEVLEHLTALKPQLETIRAAHDDRRLRFRRIKDEGVKFEPEEREKTWAGRDPQDGLWAIVDEVSSQSGLDTRGLVPKQADG